MKKLIGLLILSLLTLNIQTFASDIEFQTTMSSKTIASDRLWVGSFQLVWNDFMDKIVFGPVKFREGNPTIVNELNKQSFTTNDISEKSYYKYAGKVRKNTKRLISKSLKKKFGTNSELLDKLDLTERNDMYLIYSMLYKNFEFSKEFDKLGHFAFGDEDMAEYFGINKDSNPIIAQGVNVLFYNDPSDYAVELITMSGDEVYLYKTSSNKPFNLIYSDLQKKQKNFNGKKELKSVDELRIPVINLTAEKTYDELTNRRIMGTNLVINKAIQSVNFNMNNKGVKLKSEAGLTAVTTSLLPPEELVPRLFYFDNTFVIFIKEKKKTNPYLAIRINDITKFQK